MKKRHFPEYPFIKKILESFKGDRNVTQEIPNAVGMVIEFFELYPIKGLKPSTLSLISTYMGKPHTCMFWATVFKQALDDPEELRSFRRRLATSSIPDRKRVISGVLKHLAAKPGVGKVVTILSPEKSSKDNGIAPTYQQDILEKLIA